MPSDLIRNQICSMSDFLTKAVLRIDPQSQIQALEELRHQLLHLYKKSARPEHTQVRIYDDWNSLHFHVVSEHTAIL